MLTPSNFSRILLSSILMMGLVSCTTTQQKDSSTSSAVEDNRPLVVATTSVLCDLTEQIAQESVNLKCLVGPGIDPHVYQPTPEDRQTIDSAKLILYGGYNFDPSLIKLVKATSNSAPKIAVHEKAVPTPLMGKEHDHNHEAEHDHNHQNEITENVPDPHVWHDANNGIKMVAVISQALEKLQPNNAKNYQDNQTRIIKELTNIDDWIKEQIGTIPLKQRKLVTTHDALGYYVNAYNLEFEGALGGFSTEESPSAARVSELVKEIKKTKVPTIFAETSVNPKLIKTVAKEAKVKVSEQELYADGLGEKGTEGDTYQKMLISNTKTIVKGLGGQLNNSPLEAIQSP